MNKIIYLAILSAFIFTACTLEDNFDAPSETITGTVIDNVTGEPLRTEQPDGFRIRYKEISDQYPNAQYYYFWGKADGTFNDSKIFAGTYEITAVEGAFVTPAPQTVNVSGITEVNFSVTPYLVIKNSKISLNGTTLHAEFDIERPAGVTATLKTAFVAISWSPNVSFRTYGSTGLLKTQNITDANLGSKISFDIDISGLSTGHTWYVSMGARTSVTDRYNYSPTYTFEY